MPPAFWQQGQHPPALLSPLLIPLSWLFAAATARRVARQGWKSGVPVICCGNASVGGSGKTPLVLDLVERLRTRGRTPAILSRGHGATKHGPRQVMPGIDDASSAGDEPLLLAAVAPTFIGADRAATARLAIAAGADVLLMDDGLQNRTLHQTCNLLVIDGGVGFGNGHVIPAGPLRETPARAAARCKAAIFIGADGTGAAQALPPALPRLQAELVPNLSDLASLPPRLIAFAGIGRPDKFFNTLTAAGHAPIATRAFADHRPYQASDMSGLRAQAAAENAGLVTTSKDFVRLPPAWRHDISVLRVALQWQHDAALNTLLDTALAEA